MLSSTSLQQDPTDPSGAAVQGITQPAQPQATTGIAPTASPTPAPAPQMEDDGVASRATAITAEGSPIMRQARSDGLRAAASRGLMNSSIAVGASQDAAYRVAVPMASQEAAQAAGRNAQRLDIAAQMDRLRTSAGFESDARRETFGYQTQLNAQQYAAEKDRLTQQLTHATAAQRTEIEARLVELDRNFQNQGALAGQQFGYTRTLSQDQYAAERERLTMSLTNATEQQRTEIAARIAMLDQEFRNQSALSGQSFEQQAQLNQQQFAAQIDQIKVQQAGAVQQLQMQIDSSTGLQRTELQAQMDRLLVSNAAEIERMTVANDFNVAMMGLQQGYAVDMTRLQSSLQSQLQAQANTEQMERMTLEFENQTELQAQVGLQALDQIAARGDQELALQANTLAAAWEELTLQMNQRNTETLANSAVALFQAEAQIRAALLNNPQMPAAERAGYEQAIASLTGPTRTFLAGLLGAGSTTTPTTTTPTTGTTSPTTGGIAPTYSGSTYPTYTSPYYSPYSYDYYQQQVSTA